MRWEWDQNYIGPGPPAQILVTGLSALTTESEVLMNFRSFGEIQSFELKVDPTTGGSLGVCSITYRDNKSTKTLGHHSAKRAVQKGNNLKIAMQNIRVVLDRDGLKCAKVVDRMLADKRKQHEEVLRKEEEQAARNRPPPPVRQEEGPATRQRNSIVRRDRSPVRDHDNRFSKPRPPNYRAIDDLGLRPAVFISSKYIPGEQRFCRHLYGRLKNFGVEDILCDRDGFYVVFENRRGLDNCFRMCDGDRLFSYQMRMKPFPRGNPRAESHSRSPSPRPRAKRKFEKPNILKQCTNDVIIDLKVALLADFRKRIADPYIYDLLAPERLAKRRKTEEPAKENVITIDTSLGQASAGGNSPSVSGITFSALSAPINLKHLFPSSDGRPTQITALPRFKKHKPKRQETPTSDASPMPNGARGRKNEDARPLAHRLNNYNVDGSDDESTTTDNRPVSRGSASRALSTDIGDDDSASIAASMADLRNRKRKRSLGTRTPSRLKDASGSTDDEDETKEQVQMEVDEEATQPDMDDFVSDSEAAHRKKPRNSGDIVPNVAKKEAAEDEAVDIMGIDESSGPLVADQMQPVVKWDGLWGEGVEPLAPAPAADLTWAVTSTDYPRVTVEDDRDMIMDLDGIQAMVKDDEDLRFLRMALENQTPSNVGNPFAWTCKMKEVKAANREGKRGKALPHIPSLVHTNLTPRRGPHL